LRTRKESNRHDQGGKDNKYSPGDKATNRESGIITYGITPPKKNNTEEKIKEISQKHIERISGLDIDGLVIYDLQDEKERVSEERPFPFIETIDPQIYSENYLKI